jgi:hypothetical protein
MLSARAIPGAIANISGIKIRFMLKILLMTGSAGKQALNSGYQFYWR